ncbi:protein of unknown function [Magnetospira sp. QH-2]|nr:protein of unknown function [Magnetospira sp. QH-2]
MRNKIRFPPLKTNDSDQGFPGTKAPVAARSGRGAPQMGESPTKIGLLAGRSTLSPEAILTYNNSNQTTNVYD